MKLDKNHPKLTAYALRELPAKEMKAMQPFIERDKELSAYVADIRAMAEVLDEGFALEQPAGLSPARAERLMNIPQAARKKNFWIWGALLAPAAAALFMMVHPDVKEKVVQDTLYEPIDAEDNPVAADAAAPAAANEQAPTAPQAMGPAPAKPMQGSLTEKSQKKQDFKLPGKTAAPKAKPASRGKAEVASEAESKNREKGSVLGVSDGKVSQPGERNLSKLGQGTGKVLNKIGAPGQYSEFKSSEGGAGAGSGRKSDGPGGTGGVGGAAGRGTAAEGGRGRAVVSLPNLPLLEGEGISAQETQDVIRANLNQIRHCYDRLLQRGPKVVGKLKARWTIDTGGRVANSSVVNSSIEDDVMQGCVTSRIKRWKFLVPRNNKEVVVTVEFNFLTD